MKYIIIFLSTITLFSCSSIQSNHDKNNGPQKVVVKMANAIDTKDWKTALSQFDDIVFVDYSSMTGQAGKNISSKDLVGGWEKLLKNAQTHHMLTNFEVFPDSDSAKVISHVYASHTAKGIKYWDIYGRYHHKLKKTPEGWKITSMKLLVHGQKGNKNFLKQVIK